MDKKDKLDLLKMAHDTHRLEIGYHREVMARIFKWVSSIYLAITGGIIALGKTNWISIDKSLKIYLTLVILLILFAAIWKTVKSASGIDTNAKMVVQIVTALKFFEKDVFVKDKPLYPSKWRIWGTTKTAGFYVDINIIILSIFSSFLIFLIWYL